MKTIRKNTFETNSSSTHSITISKYQKPEQIIDVQSLESREEESFTRQIWTG